MTPSPTPRPTTSQSLPQPSSATRSIGGTAPSVAADAQHMAARLQQVRGLSRALAAPLSAEDCGAQSMPDASPVKWHLAHTTWFFETFLLQRYVSGYRCFDERFGLLFNSYYEALGPRHPRAQRGLLTRPSLEDVLAYRSHVDAALGDWLTSGRADADALALIELGLHHERQHQELLLTDVKHLLFQNPLQPAYRNDLVAVRSSSTQALRFHDVAEGRIEIGHAGPGVGFDFAFDNETPRHSQWLQPHRIAERPVNNAEFRAFIRDGGYTRSDLWLADGWAIVQSRGWQRPLYWNEDLESAFTLGGVQALVDAAPVCHVSFYEADAFARWAGARLPTEVEWEASAANLPIAGNFIDSELLQPSAQDFPKLRQMFGDVWEWTGSAYLPYPGFRTAAGAVGEYNGKFMSNQMVLRGGSCVSHADHLRASYRNFFYADARWQFSGIRLAQDLR